jgi:hypothetical protein
MLYRTNVRVRQPIDEYKKCGRSHICEQALACRRSHPIGGENSRRRTDPEHGRPSRRWRPAIRRQGIPASACRTNGNGYDNWHARHAAATGGSFSMRLIMRVDRCGNARDVLFARHQWMPWIKKPRVWSPTVTDITDTDTTDCPEFGVNGMVFLALESCRNGAAVG